MNLPNILSIFRIVLIPIFLIVFLQQPPNGMLCAVILIVSGLTDCLDGFLARKLNMVTQLGKLLDPLADKLTQLAVSVCLAIRHKEFIIILCLLILKEFIMLLGGFKLIRQGVKLPSSKWFGKLATIVFYLVMTYIVYDVHISAFTMSILIWVVLAFAVLAFVQYVPEFLKLNKNIDKSSFSMKR